MNIEQILAKYKKIEIEILLASVLNKSKEFLYLNGENRLTRKQADRLARMVKRRLKGEPIAYILGYKDFMGLRFKVNKHTLIPRPETEEMVDRVLSLKSLVFRKKIIKILDVGTGSGCIIVSVAKLLKPKSYNLKPEFYASDISPQALKAAKQNAKAHKVSVQFVLSDLLDNIKGNFDIIIANLPYVPETDYRLLIKNLKYEPKNAIFAKENGLYLIVKLLKQIAGLKYQPPLIYLEFDPRQENLLFKLIKKTLPSYKARFFKDLSNRGRFVEISPKVAS